MLPNTARIRHRNRRHHPGVFNQEQLLEELNPGLKYEPRFRFPEPGD